MGTRAQSPAGPDGFSLIEVIAAVAIFAIGMVAVLGLFAPVTKSVASVTDAEAAARVADAVRARLQALVVEKKFDAALALIQNTTDVRRNDADGTYNPNDGTKHPAVIFGKLNGDVALYDPGLKAWADFDLTRSPAAARAMLDADKFFEVDLIRNDTLSPKAADDGAAIVAYTMRVRWPAFVKTSATTAVQGGQNAGGSVPFDHGRKQALFFTGAIAR